MTRWLAALAVLVVAVVAAVVSFGHIEGVALAYGQTLLAARLLPVSVDGTIVAASMVLLDAARRGVPAPALGRVMLGLGVTATLGANAVSGEGHGLIGVAVAMLPAVFFIGSVEVLLGMIRVQAVPVGVPETVPQAAQTVPEAIPQAAFVSTPATGSGTAEALPGNASQAPGAHVPEQIFAAELAAGTVPGIRAIKRKCQVGQDSAKLIQQRLGVLVSEGSETIEATA